MARPTVDPGGGAGGAPERSEERRWRFATGAVLALATAVRFVRLAGPGLWADEASSLKVALHPLLDIAARSQDLTPPLYYAVLHLWVGLLGPSVGAIRALSAVLGVLAVALLGWVVRPLVGRRAAVLAMALLAVSPLAVFYAQMARSYSLFLTLSLASFGWLIRWEEHGRSRNAIGWVVATSAMAYTHNYWVFNFAAQQVWVLAGAARRWSRLREWAAMTGAFALLFAPWLPRLAERTLRHARWGSEVAPPDLGELFHAVQQWVVWPGVATSAGLDVPGLLSLPFAALALFGLVRLAGAPRTTAGSRPFLLLGLWASVPVLVPWAWSQTGTRIFDPPYLIAASAAYAALIARGLLDLPWRAARRGVAIFVVLVAAANLATMAGREAKQDWRGAAALLAGAGPDDTVIVSSPYHEIVLAYYREGPPAVADLVPSVPGWGVASRVGVGIDRARQRRARLWFVAMLPGHRETALALVRTRAPCATVPLVRQLEGLEVVAFDFSECR